MQCVLMVVSRTCHQKVLHFCYNAGMGIHQSFVDLIKLRKGPKSNPHFLIKVLQNSLLLVLLKISPWKHASEETHTFEHAFGLTVRTV